MRESNEQGRRHSSVGTPGDLGKEAPRGVFPQLNVDAQRPPVVPKAGRAHGPRSSADFSDARPMLAVTLLCVREAHRHTLAPNLNSRERVPLADSSPIGDSRNASIHAIELHFFE